VRSEDNFRQSAADIDVDSTMAGLLQGTSFSGGERDATFIQRASDGQYEDFSLVSGLAHPGDGRVLVRADFDRDGFVDLALVNANAPLLKIYRNQLGDERSGTAPVLALSLVGGAAPGRDGFSPRTPYGARVTLELANRSIVRELRCGEGMGAQNSAVMLFGLEHDSEVLGATIHWPSGRVSRIDAAAAGEWLTVSETEGVVDRRAYAVARPPASSTAVAAPSSQPEPFFAQRVPAQAEADLHMFVFMGTWCASCVTEIGAQHDALTHFEPGRIAVHGISDHRGDAEQLREFERRHAPPYRIEGLSEADAAAFAEFCARERIQYAVPMHVLTDGRGEVLYAGRDLPTLSEFRSLLRAQ